MILKIEPNWLKLFLEFVFFVELDDMLSQNVHKLIMKCRMDLLDMVGQHMLNKDFVDQPQMKKQV
jgi:hypothetical protein